MVWQVASHVGIGLIALMLIWWPGPYAIARLYLAALLAGALPLGFFVALYAMLLYDGVPHDNRGQQQSVAPVPTIAPRSDVTVVLGLTILLLAGVFSIGAAG